MKRLLNKKVIALLMVLSIIISACTTIDLHTLDNDKQKIIRLNNSEEPGNLHPSLAVGSHESWVLNHMFEGLFAMSEDGVVLAGAKDYKVSEDGLTWTFMLNENARWSNGDIVTAHDYLASWVFILNPDNAARYSSQLYIIKGAEEYNSNTDASMSFQLKDEVGITVIDEFTLQVELVNPIVYLPELLTFYSFYPIHERNQLENTGWYTSSENYITNGPMYLSEWRHRELLSLRKNEYYHLADRINIDGIDFYMINDKATEWAMYKQNELDLVYTTLPSVIEMLMHENSSELTIEKDLVTNYYSFNIEKVPFNNVKVRNALSMAIDREVITNHVTKGGQTPAYSFTSHGIFMPDGIEYTDYLGKLFEEDFDMARVLLQEGLAEEGMLLEDFSFTILYNTNDVQKKIAEAIQIMWNENLGINVQLENADFQVVLDRKARGAFDVVRGGWAGDYIDPMAFLKIFASFSSINDFLYNNSEYDELIIRAIQEMDAEVRMEIFKEAETILIRDMPIMPIYYGTKQIIIKPNLNGVYTPINRYPFVHYADIN